MTNEISMLLQSILNEQRDLRMDVKNIERKIWSLCPTLKSLKQKYVN